MRTQTFAPPLTVQVGSTLYTFAPGCDVTVGRGSRADVRLDGLDNELASRAHLVLRFDGTRWVAIDQSQNGTYVDGRRVSTTPIRDGQAFDIGDPARGARVVFRLGHADQAHHPVWRGIASVAARHPRPAGRTEHKPTSSETVPGFPAQPESAGTVTKPLPQLPHRSWPAATTFGDDEVTAPVPSPASDKAQPVVAKPVERRSRGIFRRRRKPFTVGRAPRSDIAVDDALVSRLQATLRPTDAGLEIRDKAGGNGTFVNGARVSRTLLRDGDVVTVGNADFTVSRGALTPLPEEARTGLEARHLGLAVDGAQVLSAVNLGARHGALTAVIGPPSPGKSALLKLLRGRVSPTCGVVSCDGQHLHAEHVRSRIALVPPDDVMHDRLTVHQVLCYAAELRLPSDSTTVERRRQVKRVMDELDLTPHRLTRLGSLSRAERRRVTAAIAVLTGPTLVILDEDPYEGDPSIGRETMAVARTLADGGRIVVVATQSLASLNLCDQVMLLTSGGRAAFVGPPARMKEVANTPWPQTLPPSDGAPSAEGEPAPVEGATSPEPEPPLRGAPARHRVSRRRQASMVARRQVRLILANRRYLAFVAISPFVFGALTVAVPGHTGLAGPSASPPGHPLEVLVVLTIAAVFMGMAMTIGEVVAERPIIRRERSAGLSVTAYLSAKVAVFGVLAAFQVAVLTAIAVLGEGAPARGAVMPRAPVAELYLALLVTATVSAGIGLALSALAHRKRDVVPLFMLVVLVSLVLCGGMFPLSSRFGVGEISWIMPSRWGFAAAAATVDVHAMGAHAHHDAVWTHSPRWWAFDMAMLLLCGAAWAGVLSWRPRDLTRKFRRRRPVRTAR